MFYDTKEINKMIRRKRELENQIMLEKFINQQINFRIMEEEFKDDLKRREYVK